MKQNAKAHAIQILKWQQLAGIISESQFHDALDGKPIKEEVNKLDTFIEFLNQTLESANKLKNTGDTLDMDFGSLIDSTRDGLREFE